MITPVVQRWRERRGVYRPASDVIDPRALEIAVLEGDREAEAFVTRHHYAGSYVAARRRFGLFLRAKLVGVAVFSVPVNLASLACLPGDPRARLELGRLVLLDQRGVGSNAESWFLARAFAVLAREGFTGCVSFSDPIPRTDARGERVFKGHIGTVYQALNARYLGRSSANTLRLLPDGHVLHKRALSKIRKRERGWSSAVAPLVALGATPLGDDDDPKAWLRRWLPRLTRKLRHTGNHKYVFGFDRQVRKHLPASLPYPKFEAP